jgi:hypothetical protein
MKKYFYLLAMAFFAIQIQSCSSDDDGGAPVDNLETNYLTIENAVFNDQDFPEATLDEPLDGVDMSSQVMNGAMNYISVVTEKEIQKFFIGVKGVDGYWEMDASTTITRATQYNTYVIPVMISQNYFGNSVIQVSGMLTDGSITLPIEKEMEYIETKLGDLEVKLAFSNCKDVDLHLYTPSEEHIYYGHKGGTYYTEDGDTITYGLDIDSNAGCRIDSINKENIYIPQELIEAGTYKVVVNMYSNCDRTIPTSWSVVVRYKGELIATSTGENPATGVYPVGVGNGDYTEAMTFVIEEPEVRGARRSRIIPESFEPIPMTDMDMMKLADEQ